MKEQDAAFLEYIAKEIVEYPDDIKIDRKVDEMGVLITLDVHPEDMGKIIGRAGSTAKAIRTLLRVIGFKNNSRVNLKINEPEGTTTEKTPTEEQTTNNTTKETNKKEDSVSEDIDKAIEDLKTI